MTKHEIANLVNDFYVKHDISELLTMLHCAIAMMDDDEVARYSDILRIAGVVK